MAYEKNFAISITGVPLLEWGLSRGRKNKNLPPLVMFFIALLYQSKKDGA